MLLTDNQPLNLAEFPGTASSDNDAFFEFVYLLEGCKKFIAIWDDTIGWIFE